MIVYYALGKAAGMKELKKKIHLHSKKNLFPEKKISSNLFTCSPEKRMFFFLREIEKSQKEKAASSGISDDWINSLIKQYMEEHIPTECI